MRPERRRELVACASPVAQCTLGISGDHIALCIDGIAVRLDAQQADQLAADLRMFALELRHGGRLP